LNHDVEIDLIDTVGDPTNVCHEKQTKPDKSAILFPHRRKQRGDDANHNYNDHP
jgi:hypothetical protein